MKVNLEGVKTNFEALPEGEYTVALEKWTEKRAKVKDGAKTSTSTNISLTLDVVEPEQYQGRKLFKQINVADDGGNLWSLKRELIKMGVPADTLEEDDLDTDTLFASVKTGGTFMVKASIRLYEGKEQNDVEIVDPEAAAVLVAGW